MNQQEEQYLFELEQEIQGQRIQNRQLSNSQQSLFNVPDEQNLIRWQLDLREDLDRIYHLLRGDIIREDEKGNMIHVAPDNDDLRPFNEFGVQMIMNVLSFYLNRNTLLSNYDDETIQWKVLDFGNEINDLIYCRYEEFMITTNFEKEFEKLYGIKCEATNNNKFVIRYIENGVQVTIPLSKEVVYKVEEKIHEHIYNKSKLYPMIVKELVDSVHSAYLRALDSGERESLRTARTVTQMDPLNKTSTINNIMTPKKGFLNRLGIGG